MPRVRRLDRYGLVVDLGGTRWMRLEFARPVSGRHDLAHLMHPILFHRHRAPDGCDG